jgi:Ca2+-binding RTX toxin-like protein
MAFAVLNGAQNEDLLEVNAKMEVMQTFVSRLQADPALAAGYAGNQAALVARNFLATVTGETAAQLEATKASALVALPAAVQQVSAAGVASGAATPGTTTPGTAAPGASTTPGASGTQTPLFEQAAPVDDEPSTGTDGADTLTGTVLDDGTAIDDVLEGFAGADTMDGGAGDDWLLAGSGNDSLTGGTGNDTLDGQYGNDTLLGGDGNDLLESGAGADRLTGGAGADEFHFSADDFYAVTRSLTAADADVITDFTSGTDRLVLVFFGSNSFGFSGLSAARTASGGLDASAFLSGAGAAAATSASHRLIYDSTAGVLRYDADGSGSGAAFVVATLTGTLALTAADFGVISSA